MLDGKKILPTKILVKRLDEKREKTDGGIYLPTEVVKETTSAGVVIIAGEGTEMVPNPVIAGQHVMYPPRAPILVHYEGEDYYLLDIRDILLYW